MPEIALDPDISGVWSCEGTLAMSSKPRNTASVKANNNSSNGASSMMIRMGLKRSWTLAAMDEQATL